MPAVFGVQQQFRRLTQQHVPYQYGPGGTGEAPQARMAASEQRVVNDVVVAQARGVGQFGCGADAAGGKQVRRLSGGGQVCSETTAQHLTRCEGAGQVGGFQCLCDAPQLRHDQVADAGQKVTYFNSFRCARHVLLRF